MLQGHSPKQATPETTSRSFSSRTEFNELYRDVGLRTVTANVESRVWVHCDMVAVRVDWRNRPFTHDQSLQLEQRCENRGQVTSR
jgi:hypothetical protein